MLPQASAEKLLCTIYICTKEKSGPYAQSFSLSLRRMGLEAHPYLGNALAFMLVGMQSMKNARRVFDQLTYPSVSCWNCLIQGYVRGNEIHHAFILYLKMEEKSLHPSESTYACLLKCCTKLQDLETGSRISKNIMRKKLFRANLFIGNMLIDMYGKCGALTKSQEIFSMLPIRDVVTWSILINAYLQHGYGNESLHCFEQMQLEGISPNAVTFVYGLKACSSIGALDKGREMHEQIDRRGSFERDLVILNALVDMYARCGCLAKALVVFDQIFIRDVCSWNSLITGYTQHDFGKEAVECFQQMQQEGICPNEVTFICTLNACSCAGADSKGKEIHSQLTRIEYFKTNVLLGNMLVDMYAKCGMLADAEAAFDSLLVKDVISWTSLIAGYVQHDLNEEALQSFEQMRSENSDPNAVTFACILKTCGSIRAEEMGREIHIDVTKKGLDGDVLAGNALIDMYAKCALLFDAHEVLKKLVHRDTISWNALITGYIQQDEGEEALSCFKQMQTAGMCPNAITFICVLSVCGSLVATDKGMEIHAEIDRGRLMRTHLLVCTALVSMYAKCGLLVQAQEVFDKIPNQDAALWNSLITGYALLGDFVGVLVVWRRMEGTRVKPDAVTFLSMLNGCSHAGLVEESMACFEAMNEKSGVPASVEHYTCMLDLLSRAGRLEETHEVLDGMPFHPHSVMLTIVLGACQKWGFVELGEGAFGHALHLDGDDAASYVSMSNIYAHAGSTYDPLTLI